mmetsp:Transcript_11130/g.19647  ORF Transcript_11130/g.19647 Transcript_11130/m.19647 type:complete len:213 (+) Transcript_11130:3176-3814(+)
MMFFGAFHRRNAFVVVLIRYYGGVAAFEFHFLRSDQQLAGLFVEVLEGLDVQQNTPFGFAHQARGHVDVSADACVVSSFWCTHGAAEHISCGDADAAGMSQGRSTFDDGHAAVKRAGCVVRIRERGHAPHGDKHTTFVVHQELSEEPARFLQNALGHQEERLQRAGVAVELVRIGVETHEHRGHVAQLANVFEGFAVDGGENRSWHKLCSAF